MDFIDEIIVRAKADKQRIVLPEGTEERTIKAADKVLADKLADIVLIGSHKEIKSLSVQWGLKNISKATIIDPVNNPDMDMYANLLYELRKEKGMTLEEAEKKALDPLYLGCLIIKAGHADGQLAGAHNITSNVLRPALQIIKTAPGITSVSGAFIMLTKMPRFGENGILVFADCAVTPVPNASQLAQIAICSANTAKTLVGFQEPRVALLSFSTKGSAQHDVINKVLSALSIAREMDPSLKIDGELQADAAIVPSVGLSKAPGSDIAGCANVLVFPNLEVGNIAYKLVQRIGKVEALGPVLQGIASPVNDLSRGCSVKDIYKMVAVTANQSIVIKKNVQVYNK
ncbi:MAG TPA: phosphate acetyltransferase [Bacteroidaceae bacterium]|nr:phosphate acetyltransferase [Bacteroidaceae bacterium]